MCVCYIKITRCVMCIGNRVQFAFILDNFDIFLDEEITITSNFFFNYVEFKLPFTWALAIWRLLSGNVAFRDIAEIYSLLVPLYSGGGTVHPSLTKEMTIYSSDFILIRNSALLCWSGPWKNNILCSIWWTLTWSTRWDWYSTETDCWNLAKTR